MARSHHREVASVQGGKLRLAEPLDDGEHRAVDEVHVEIPSVVPIEDRGAVVGKVLCDDLLTISTSRLKRAVGALPPRIMRDVSAGPRSALDCEPET
jgi:hypothetical protein